MSVSDGRRWDDRYSSSDVVTAGTPPDALADAGLADIVPVTGRSLDVACGLGAQSIWLAERGLSVVAVDVSVEAIRRLDSAAQRMDCSDRVDARLFDLDGGLPDGPFDVIVCQRFRAVDLYDAFVERLAPGALLVVTVLSVVGADRPGEFHAPHGELTAAFTRPGLEVLFDSESNGHASLVARRHR
mgnify:CR=1 FL=1